MNERRKRGRGGYRSDERKKIEIGKIKKKVVKKINGNEGKVNWDMDGKEERTNRMKRSRPTEMQMTRVKQIIDRR